MPDWVRWRCRNGWRRDWVGLREEDHDRAPKGAARHPPRGPGATLHVRVEAGGAGGRGRTVRVTWSDERRRRVVHRPALRDVRREDLLGRRAGAGCRSLVDAHPDVTPVVACPQYVKYGQYIERSSATTARAGREYRRAGARGGRGPRRRRSRSTAREHTTTASTRLTRRMNLSALWDGADVVRRQEGKGEGRHEGRADDAEGVRHAAMRRCGPSRRTRARRLRNSDGDHPSRLA